MYFWSLNEQMYKSITSIQNPLIKQLLKLQEKARERKNNQEFVFEGLRELELANASSYFIKKILFSPDLLDISTIQNQINPQTELIEISRNVFQKLAYRNSTEGIICLAQHKTHLLKEVKLPKNPLILIAEAPEKPGNIGAILRTADAANVDAILIANPKTDLYNPNIIRSSVGCVFTNQIAMGSTAEIILFLKEKNILIYCAALVDNAKIYHTQNFTKSTAIVVGSEATGLSDEWLDNATQNIIIPMRGKIDSMNVSVATGILIYEAVRQRDL